MAALFRIVQDDVPPLPGGVSEALRDFLLQCFNRESVLRAGAKAPVRVSICVIPIRILREWSNRVDDG